MYELSGLEQVLTLMFHVANWSLPMKNKSLRSMSERSQVVVILGPRYFASISERDTVEVRALPGTHLCFEGPWLNGDFIT